MLFEHEGATKSRLSEKYKIIVENELNEFMAGKNLYGGEISACFKSMNPKIIGFEIYLFLPPFPMERW